jgi:hypothetical protein
MTEQNVQTAPEQSPEQKAAAEKAAEQERAECRKSASAHVDKAEACVKRAERGYSEGYLLAGYHADLALSLRLKAGDKRDAALQAIEGRLAEQSSTVVKADRLIACWHSFRLLHGAKVDDKGKLSDAPPFCYGHFDKAWSQLVQRVNKGKADEHWTLLPGLEAECLQAYKSALDNGTNRDGCMDAASGLKRQLADRQAKDKADAEARAKAEREAKEQAEREALKAEQAAKEAAKRAEEAAKQAAENTPEAVAKREEAERKAKEAAEAERQRMAAEAEKHIAAQKAAQAERDAKEALQRQIDAEAKRAELERKRAERESNKGSRSASAPPVNKPQLPTCIGTAKAAASAKELAQLLADMIRESGKEVPEVMEHLAASLDWSPKMGTALLRGMAKRESAATARAMHALLSAALPSANGQAVAKAA